MRVRVLFLWIGQGLKSCKGEDRLAFIGVGLREGNRFRVVWAEGGVGLRVRWGGE